MHSLRGKLLKARGPARHDILVEFEHDGERYSILIWSDSGRAVWGGATRVGMRPPTHTKPASRPSPRLAKLKQIEHELPKLYGYRR